MKIEINVDRHGHGKMIVDGNDISDHVLGVRFTAGPNDVTRVEFDVVGDVSLVATDADVEIRPTG